MSTRSPESNEVAVSVIIGTLLLILITVTAASALALMVSQMQKEEMNRQAHQAQVKNEQLKVQYIHLTRNNTTGYTDYWDTANITILNLNTDESRVLTLSVNGVYAKRINVTGQPFNDTQPYYDVSQNQWISIPATQKADFFLNFSSDFLQSQLKIPTNQSIHILVMTSLYNTFERTFVPPVPVMKISTDTQDLGITQKTILVFDGTGSYSTGGNIVDYIWSVFDKSTNNTVIRYGPVVKSEMPSSGPFDINLTVTDDSGLTQTSLNTTIAANPSFAPPTHIRVQPNTSFSVGDSYPNPPYTNYKIVGGVDAWVNDSSDNPVSNQVISFTQQGNINVTLSLWSGVTGSGGNPGNPVTTFVLTPNVSLPYSVGVVTASSGKLPPQNI
ncbi:MAG TPA: PKD domain-containing protein [Methanoregulaceae archaeon]|nr:PKD domain-containing protein [Methanoregulaceae archaeon]